MFFFSITIFFFGLLDCDWFCFEKKKIKINNIYIYKELRRKEEIASCHPSELKVEGSHSFIYVIVVLSPIVLSDFVVFVCSEWWLLEGEK